MKDIEVKMQEMEIRQAITDTKLDTAVKEIESVASKIHRYANTMQSIELTFRDLVRDLTMEVERMRRDNDLENAKIEAQIKEVSKEFATKWGLAVSIFLGGLVFVKDIFLKVLQ